MIAFATSFGSSTFGSPPIARWRPASSYKFADSSTPSLVVQYECGSAKKVSRKVLNSKNHSNQRHDYLVNYMMMRFNAKEKEKPCWVIRTRVMLKKSLCKQHIVQSQPNVLAYNARCVRQRCPIHSYERHYSRWTTLCARSWETRVRHRWFGRQRQGADSWVGVRRSTAKSDYHKNMNGDNFMKWVEHRLFPGFNY